MTKTIKKIIRFIAHPKENYANWYFLKYHILKAVYKINKKIPLPGFIKFNRTSAPSSDMFNWSLYNLYYRGEIRETAKHYTINLRHGDYVFKNSVLVRAAKDIKPLHPNHRLLYETALQLNPSSIFEMGCGNGMHLHNLQLLLPDAKLYGIDRSQDQINFLKESYPQLRADIQITDATADFSSAWLNKADLSFTQAVIMHIHSGQSHLTALANLFNVSKKYVILMERWKNHDFMDDILALHKKKVIRWEKIYFSYKISEEFGVPHMMVCSNQTLNLLNLHPLKDYETLQKR